MSHRTGGTLAGLVIPNKLDTVPFGLQIAMQQVHKVSCLIFLGRNEAVGTTEETIWAIGGDPVLPTVAGTITVVCSSSDDTGVGIGAQVLHVQGLDHTFSTIEEEITLNGTTPVVSTQEYIRVNHAQVHEVGSSDVNIGTLTGSVGGNPLFRVEPRKGSAHNGYYTIASGTTGYVENIAYSSGKNATLLGCFYKKEPGAAWILVDEVEIYRTNITSDFNSCIILPEMTEIKLTAVSDTGTNSISARSTITIVQDSPHYPQVGVYEFE